MILTHGANSLKRGGEQTVTIVGREYPVVKIGNQLWMAENLDYAWEGLVVGASGADGSQQRANYFNDDEPKFGYNGLKYGLLYTRTAALYLYQHRNTLLPDGWRLPSLVTNDQNTDVRKLINVAADGHGDSAGIINLKSSTGWRKTYSVDCNGNDTLGFNAYPTGYRNHNAYYTGVTMNNGQILYGDRFGMITHNNSNETSSIQFLDELFTGKMYLVQGIGDYQYSIRLVKDA